MKLLFQKTNFPKPSGGNCYEWNGAETIFKINNDGLFCVEITASAKSAKQNDSTDDDDLRVAIDGFSFGKYEKHQSEISWKGFGVSASWDGASLKGSAKTNYFFMELSRGTHKIQFFADETPAIESLKIFKIEDKKIHLKNLVPTRNIISDKNGIPWLSLVFIGTHAKSILLDVDTKSAKEKAGTDGDNLKVVVNGKILQNKQAPSSRKYKNFYFSGDIKSTGILSIGNDDLSIPLAFENSVELWYDQEPKINSLQIDFFDTEKFLKEYESLVDLHGYVLSCAWIAKKYFENTSRNYSAKFLEHSLEENPGTLIFRANHPIIGQIKADPIYEKILKKLKEKVSANILEGEIWPEDIVGKISFGSHDLKTAIHGIKKIEYKAEAKKNGEFEVKMTLLDVYDFEKQDVPLFLFHGFDFIQNTIINAADMGEDLHVVHNFEIQIHITDHLNETD